MLEAMRLGDLSRDTGTLESRRPPILIQGRDTPRRQNDKEGELVGEGQRARGAKGGGGTEPGHIRQERTPHTSGRSNDRHERPLLGTTHRGWCGPRSVDSLD